ncbi:chaperone protein DNAJ putatative [Leptomonas seymouri]|uniref:Chaperone protein DNAJ putatative n=1 Tax=Leptomonas seymouri TaxID=5684 RepID=A0A0N1PBL0_LEPSE|nr:chaperone protein DNAJ putatative [Leptomonas seymouri]|eukprot:KPI85798.1 chaperone protein DNAJ putatative [Leptomonas seymouri]
MFKDYYAVLGVSPRATGDEIRSTFRRLALLYHPDRTLAGVVDPIHGTQPDEASSSPQPPSLLGGNGYTGTATSSLPPDVEMTLPSASSIKDFTVIQEAYEVLGDVARRYLYDLNYQESLRQKEQQRQEELACREANLRALEEATRQARERERKREQRAQALSQTRLTAPSCVSLPMVGQPNHIGVSCSLNETAPSAVAAGSPPSELPPIVKCKNTLSNSERVSAAMTIGEDVLDVVDVAGPSNSGGIGSRDNVYSSTVPPLDLLRHRRREERWRLREFNKTVPNLTTSAGARLLSKQHLLQSRVELSLPSTFIITNSISLAAKRNSSSTSLLSTRAAGGKPGILQGSLAEVPIEYYHQRSIERTLRVFFADSKAT